jgi:hypothetical protein
VCWVLALAESLPEKQKQVVGWCGRGVLKSGLSLGG